MNTISCSPLFFQLLYRGGGDGGVTAGLHGSIISHRKFRSLTIVAAKKSKKTKSQPPPVSDTPPPSITSNLKESGKKVSAPLLPSRYRRKRVTENRTEPSDDPPKTLNSLESDIKKTKEGPKVLFVDGYNVCGYWPKLKTEFMGGNLEAARQMLIKELIIFSGMNEMEVVVVFDASRSGLVTRKEHHFGIQVVYSSKTSADLWIDNEVERLMAAKCSEQPEVIVASSDRDVMNETYFKGAFVWNCETLISEIEDARQEMEISDQRSRIFTEHNSLLKNTLHPEVLSRLKNIKRTLALKEMQKHNELSRANGASSNKVSRPKSKVLLMKNKLIAMKHKKGLEDNHSPESLDLRRLIAMKREKELEDNPELLDLSTEPVGICVEEEEEYE